VTDPKVIRNDGLGRYELSVGGEMAQLTFRRADRQVVFVHTTVPEGLRGEGVGTQLVRGALEDARVQGLAVVPRCPFVRAWLNDHPAVAASMTIVWPVEG
jgi:uncharacterized protein